MEENNNHIKENENTEEETNNTELTSLDNTNIEIQDDETEKIEIPHILPILPLRGLVVYPQTAVPLTIGQPRSIQLVDEVMASDRMIGLVTSKNPELENPNPDDLYEIGTLATIHRMFRAPDGTIRLVVQGLSRFKTKSFVAQEPYLKAIVEASPETENPGLETEALARNVRELFQHIAEMIPSIPGELVASITSIQDPLQTAYTISNFQRMENKDSQEILEIDSIHDKLKKLVNILTRESEVLEIGQKIQNEAREEIDKVQREYFLREQLKAIQRELGEGDESSAEIQEFRQKIKSLGMPEEAEKLSIRELDRLEKLPTAAAEYGVIRTFIEWIISLPWSETSEDNLDIPHVREILDKDHFGLEDVKERILEFLAVRKLLKDRTIEDKDGESTQEEADPIRKTAQGFILCFVGPPGVGKTSLGRSIARALNRNFIRLSLGGVRDEAEIRGHRRTYIGAMPGRIIQSIRRIGTNNPVFMLDEIDKLSSDFRGDPASALLEVLDPEQNNEFRDNYLEAPFDLSKVMFITTANQLDTIPLPLLDRMEIIRISGYTENEKLNIAKMYLIPRQIRKNGLKQDEIGFQNDAITTIIRSYTKESGVRNLEREISTICRKIATAITENREFPQSILSSDIGKLLGKPKFKDTEDIIRRTSQPGVATGLAWTPFGGDVLFIEATIMPGSKGFTITGSIGKVMQESAQTALSLVKSKAKELAIDPDLFNNNDIHLHVPAGAQPKDGPSAGITIATAFVSLFTDKLIRSDIAMTGEITLKGQVLPVGGIKEKILAAHRSGINTVILPKNNEMDLDDIPLEVKNEMTYHLVEDIKDVLNFALEKDKKN